MNSRGMEDFVSLSTVASCNYHMLSTISIYIKLNKKANPDFETPFINLNISFYSDLITQGGTNLI